MECIHLKFNKAAESDFKAYLMDAVKEYSSNNNFYM